MPTLWGTFRAEKQPLIGGSECPSLIQTDFFEAYLIKPNQNKMTFHFSESLCDFTYQVSVFAFFQLVIQGLVKTQQCYNTTLKACPCVRI